MTKRGKKAPSAAITSGLYRLLDGVGVTLGRKEGWRSVLRTAQQNRILGIVYDSESGALCWAGFTSGGFTGILHEGLNRCVLPSGTTAVHVETMSGSPVSGLPFVAKVHLGKFPYVDVLAPISGILGQIHPLKNEQSDPPEPSFGATAVKCVTTTLNRPPKPHTCCECASEVTYWDGQRARRRCCSCGRNRPIT